MSILLKRLEHDFGVTGNTLLWMASYLSGWTQAVTINGTLSSPLPLVNGMPQGSRIGPNEFPGYTSPIFAIAKKHNVEVHMYADDTQLFVPFRVGDFHSAKDRLEACIAEIRTWLSENHLKLNDEKTEYMIIGKKRLVNKIEGEQSLKIGNSVIQPSSCAKNIGAMLDSELDMKAHVNHIARASYHQLRTIGRIRQNIDGQTAETLIHSFISSKLDYMNSLLAGVPDYVVHKLQLIQNNAARLVVKKKKRDHITPIMKQLHWLPIKSRIKFKICLLTFKALNGSAPPYIASLISRYEPGRALRSASQSLLQPKYPNLINTGGRAFAVCAPQMWNSLPEDLRQCTNLEGFKKGLKTHLFREYYCNC